MITIFKFIHMIVNAMIDKAYMFLINIRHMERIAAQQQAYADMYTWIAQTKNADIQNSNPSAYVSPVIIIALIIIALIVVAILIKRNR